MGYKENAAFQILWNFLWRWWNASISLYHSCNVLGMQEEVCASCNDSDNAWIAQVAYKESHTTNPFLNIIVFETVLSTMFIENFSICSDYWTSISSHMHQLTQYFGPLSYMWRLYLSCDHTKCHTLIVLPNMKVLYCFSFSVHSFKCSFTTCQLKRSHILFQGGKFHKFCIIHENFSCEIFIYNCGILSIKDAWRFRGTAFRA